MCLVSYIPIKDGFILSSNRDESPLRSDAIMTKEEVHGHILLYPKDMKGGSWLYLSNEGNAICVLNGAFVNHKRSLPYKISRGLMMRHYFDFKDASDFIQRYDFVNIESFTMVIKETETLFEFRWDGMYKYIERLNIDEVYIWSSSTLYTKEEQDIRESLFREMLSENPNLEEIQHVHLTGSLGNKNIDFNMNRNDRVATISHTNAIVDSGEMKLHYHNLLTSEKKVLNI